LTLPFHFGMTGLRVVSWAMATPIGQEVAMAPFINP